MTREQVFMLIVFVAGILALALSGYWFLQRKSRAAPVIDEKYAQEVVRQALALSGPLTAKRLAGGLSDAQLFRVTGGGKEYVAKFIPVGVPRKKIELECANMKVASDGGYGPHVYFTDPARGLVIMEYLPDNPITLKDLQSERFSVLLADLLRKIHQGPAFSTSVDVFDLVLQEIQKGKSGWPDSTVPLAQLEDLVRIIKKTSLARVGPVPCHNDLHPGNLIFLGDHFKTIDFDIAAQSNPYFDIARLAICSGFNPVDEKRLLTNYLGREPSAHEQAELYLMNQTALISDAVDSILSAPENIHQYEPVQVPLYGEFLTEFFAGKIDLGDPANRVKIAKTMINQVLANAQTHEFRDAIKLLS